jgi:hypothetical protein
MNRFNDAEILSKSNVGVEFEFYSNKTIKDTARELATLLDKKIRVEDKAHSDFVPTDKEFKIEPDFSGGEKLMELVTGAQDYRSARLMIIKVSEWIKENGFTNDRSSIHLNLSFDSNKIDDKRRISNMNVLKFILDFDEDSVFELFPQRENSAYAKSIKFVLPNSETFNIDGGLIDENNFTFPKSKYYGINFEKRTSNYLEFRYIGGKDWEKKTAKILHLLDSFLVQLWKSTESRWFSGPNSLELKKILSKNKRIIDARIDSSVIEKKWKNIDFTVDLHKDKQIIDLHWANIQKKVLRLFTHGALKKGHINYDTDTGKVQVKDGELSYCVGLDGYDFIDCDIRGELVNCDIFGGTMDGSDIEYCNFYNGVKIHSTKLKNCYIGVDSIATDCYIYGRGILKGKMIKGIFREGTYDKKRARFKGTEKLRYVEV